MLGKVEEEPRNIIQRQRSCHKTNLCLHGLLGIEFGESVDHFSIGWLLVLALEDCREQRLVPFVNQIQHGLLVTIQTTLNVTAIPQEILVVIDVRSLPNRLESLVGRDSPPSLLKK